MQRPKRPVAGHYDATPATMNLGAGSALKRLMKAKRIAAGLRPKNVPEKNRTYEARDRFGNVVTKTETLHPTKGWRRQ